MKIKITKKIIFIATACFQLIVFSVILTKNILIKKNAVKNNRIYSFECTFYDPYNVLKGRYVQLTISNSTCNKADFDAESYTDGRLEELMNNEMVFLMLKPNALGYWEICGLRQKRPKDGNFIKAKYRYSYNDNYYFDFLCSEYYMQENYAQYADSLRGEISKIKLEIYSDTKGNVIQKQLYLAEEKDFIPVEQYVKDRI